MKDHIKLLDKLIQERLERLPRAIKGDAPKKRLINICNEIDSLKYIKDVVEIKEEQDGNKLLPS